MSFSISARRLSSKGPTTISAYMSTSAGTSLCSNVMNSCSCTELGSVYPAEGLPRLVLLVWRLMGECRRWTVKNNR